MGSPGTADSNRTASADAGSSAMPIARTSLDTKATW